MNIFVLDYDLDKCAASMCDKHVVKMVLETAQLLSAAVRKISPDNIPESAYKLTHASHPCTKWASESRANFNWLRELGLAISREYTHRYGKIHKSSLVIEDMPILAGGDEMTKFAQAMPLQFKKMDAVAAYRAYYIGDKLLSIQVTFSKRQPPDWLLDKASWKHDGNRWYIEAEKQSSGLS